MLKIKKNSSPPIIIAFALLVRFHEVSIPSETSIFSILIS